MTKNRRHHTPEQIVKKLRDAEVMLNAGNNMEEVLKMLEVGESTFNQWHSPPAGA